MKISETLKTKKAEESFAAALVIILLLIVPMWGGVAMLVGSAIGLAAYALLFKERLRSRGWLTFVVTFAAAAVLGAALTVLLAWGH